MCCLTRTSRRSSVRREGVNAAAGARAVRRSRDGRRLKLVARGRASMAESTPASQLEELDARSAGDSGRSSQRDRTRTWPPGRIVITERDGGLEKTAYALVTDLVTVAKRIGLVDDSGVVHATGPLSGLTILDLSRVLSGPYCTMLAADMGARVIKIEHPIAATTRAPGGRRSWPAKARIT